MMDHGGLDDNGTTVVPIAPWDHGDPFWWGSRNGSSRAAVTDREYSAACDALESSPTGFAWVTAMTLSGVGFAMATSLTRRSASTCWSTSRCSPASLWKRRCPYERTPIEPRHLHHPGLRRDVRREVLKKLGNGCVTAPSLAPLWGNARGEHGPPPR